MHRLKTSTRIARLRWWAAMPGLPVAALQGRIARRRIPLLPEAEGARRGAAGTGEPVLRLAVIGESTAAGVGVATQADGLAAQVASTLVTRGATCVRWQAVGRTGLVVDKAARELLPELEGTFDRALVVFGVNDTLKLTRERVWLDGVRGVEAALVRRGVRRVVFTTAPPFEHMPTLPRLLRGVLAVRARFLNALLAEAVAGMAEARLVPFEAFEAGDLARDGFHPSERGYARWAARIADELA